MRTLPLRYWRVTHSVIVPQISLESIIKSQIIYNTGSCQNNPFKEKISTTIIKNRKLFLCHILPGSQLAHTSKSDNYHKKWHRHVWLKYCKVFKLLKYIDTFKILFLAKLNSSSAVALKSCFAIASILTLIWGNYYADWCFNTIHFSFWLLGTTKIKVWNILNCKMSYNK